MTTLAAELKCDRLTHRARRVERVLLALDERRRDGAVPQALKLASDEFTRQLAEVRAELLLADASPPAPSW